ncbi:MAG: transposase [Leptospiraceae bacterium]|nr:transposase [Leptospiraceae bacterium]
MSDKLPRVERIIELSESEKTCNCCGGKLVEIGDYQSERLQMGRLAVYIERAIRMKYACRQCKSKAVMAPLPYALPHSTLANGAFAQIVVSKFCDGLPLHRVSKIWQRYGVEFSAKNMANSLILFHRLYGATIMGLLCERLLESPILNIDETTVQVMNEEGRANTTKSYVWTLVGKDVAVFIYRVHRNANFLFEYLAGVQPGEIGDTQATCFAGALP